MWQQLTIHTSAVRAEPISDLLEARGALAVTLKDAADQPVFEPLPGETPLWQQTVVIGLFPKDIVLDPCIAALRSLLEPDTMPRYNITTLDDQDWERVCLDQFQPMCFGQKLWICPSWQKAPENAETVVLLDPGLAFGTGTHPTTTLCLEWLDSHPVSGCQVIDFGCGSGVLGLAALKLGASHIYAVDIDPQAILATRQNAEKNGLLDSITISQDGTIKDLKVDILLANILAAPLVNMAEQLVEYLHPTGKLVLSGILENQAQHVIDRYSSWVDFASQQSLDGWVRLEGRKRG